MGTVMCDTTTKHCSKGLVWPIVRQDQNPKRISGRVQTWRIRWPFTMPIRAKQLITKMSKNCSFKSAGHAQTLFTSTKQA
jgi:hypothetical protein